jgi:hypothetical protein
VAAQEQPRAHGDHDRDDRDDQLDGGLHRGQATESGPKVRGYDDTMSAMRSERGHGCPRRYPPV